LDSDECEAGAPTEKSARLGSECMAPRLVVVGVPVLDIRAVGLILMLSMVIGYLLIELWEAGK
jgi:hypothetical protein